MTLMQTWKWVIVGLLGFTLLMAGPAGLIRAPAQDCTLTVQPGQSIQSAIDQAPRGAILCLEEGIFQDPEGFFVHLEIKKDRLTLRGAGPRKTILRNTVLHIQGIARPLEGVLVEDLALLALDDPGRVPYLVNIDFAEVTMRSVRIGMPWDALEPRRAGGILSNYTLRLKEARLFNLGTALLFEAALGVKVEIEQSLFFTNDSAIVLEDVAGTLRGVNLMGNGLGLWVKGKSEVEVYDSKVGFQGATLYLLSGDGIIAQENAVLRVKNSQIVNNFRYGISVWLQKCGFDKDDFTGRVELIDTVVEGNEHGDLCLP